MGAFGNWFGRIIRAGENDQRRRRYIYATPQDTKMDLTTASRRQVLGLARYFYYNNPVVRGAIDSITRNSIGPGIKCQARTSDEGWNRATEEWFRGWEIACDVRGILDWSAFQGVACRAMLRDNEVFVLLVDNGDGWPQLQMVEAHRCETPGYLTNEKRVFDGVRTNANGRPLSYYIRTGDGDKYTEVQASDLIVLAERDRPDELRSISRLVTCLNLLQDRDEILDHEVQGVKRAGAIGLALEGQGATGFFGNDTTNDEDLTTDQVLGGGAIWNLPAGKTLKEIKNDRPGPNLQEFMDQILRAAAAGLGLPYEYLWKADLSGPSQRFVLAQAQRRFDEVAQAMTTQLVSRVRLWALAKAIKRGDLTPPRGMDRWWQAVYHTPQRTTIDAGRDSAADREDLKLGLTTMAHIYASRGEDWQEAVDQKITEAVYIRRKAEEAGLLASDVQFIPNQPAAITPPSATPADEVPVQTPAPELADATITATMTAPVQITETTAQPAPVLDPEPAKTEAFTMRDEPDLELTDKELDMVAKAIGLKERRAKKKK